MPPTPSEVITYRHDLPARMRHFLLGEYLNRELVNIPPGSSTEDVALVFGEACGITAEFIPWFRSELTKVARQGRIKPSLLRRGAMYISAGKEYRRWEWGPISLDTPASAG